MSSSLENPMPYIHAGACGRTVLSSIVDESCGRTFLADEGNCVSHYAEAQPEGLQFDPMMQEISVDSSLCYHILQYLSLVGHSVIA